MLAFQYWGDECVVYNVQSGDTHLLSYLHAEILQQNRQGVEVHELTSRIMGKYSLDSEEATEILHFLFAEFKALGLINSF